MTSALTSPETRQTFHDLRAAPAVAAKIFSSLRRRALLDGCKWDPQVGDLETLAPFPLVLKSSIWNKISFQAEQLAQEAVTAEEEISRRPELLGLLGLPRRLRNILAEKTPPSPEASRVMRFDFHYTTQGWRISEVNSDVPGGFSEASYFTGMMAEQFPSLRVAGNPAMVLSEALTEEVNPPRVVALLSAPGYMEDHQVIAFLAAQLRDRGGCPYLAKPEQINWRDGRAFLETKWHRGPLDAIVRFYQSEWLSRLPEKSGWKYFFRGGKTRLTNPGVAVISESKRFPLVWGKLATKLPMWQALLPETRDPRDAPWGHDDGWLLKTALCNTGDMVSARQWMGSRQWIRTRAAAFLSPRAWVAQRRFESVPVATPAGLRHACVGVYTINGRTAGAYARLSEKPLIDFAAADVALLLEDDD